MSGSSGVFAGYGSSRLKKQLREQKGSWRMEDDVRFEIGDFQVPCYFWGKQLVDWKNIVNFV